jgi:hypothetical protein
MHVPRVEPQELQDIGILQQAEALGQGSSSCPHIISRALSSLADLWQMIIFKILNLICYCWLLFCSPESYLRRVFFPLFFVDCLFLFFSLGCVYLCFFLPCTYDWWVSVLDFYIHDISSFLKTYRPYCLHISEGPWPWDIGMHTLGFGVLGQNVFKSLGS